MKKRSNVTEVWNAGYGDIDGIINKNVYWALEEYTADASLSITFMVDRNLNEIPNGNLALVLFVGPDSEFERYFDLEKMAAKDVKETAEIFDGGDEDAGADVCEKKAAAFQRIADRYRRAAKKIRRNAANRGQQDENR